MKSDQTLPPLVDPKPRRLTLSDIVERQLAALTHASGEHSSVKLSRNSRGDVQIEVTVRTGDEGVVTIADARVKAQQQYDLLAHLYPMSGGADAARGAVSPQEAGDDGGTV